MLAPHAAYQIFLCYDKHWRRLRNYIASHVRSCGTGLGAVAIRASQIRKSLTSSSQLQGQMNSDAGAAELMTLAAQQQHPVAQAIGARTQVNGVGYCHGGFRIPAAAMRSSYARPSCEWQSAGWSERSGGVGTLQVNVPGVRMRSRAVC